MVVPGIAFFMEDFGQYTVPLRAFGVLLILLMIYDIWNKKDISQYVCKVIYFPLFLIVWGMKIKAQIKKNKRETFEILQALVRYLIVCNSSKM